MRRFFSFIMLCLCLLEHGVMDNGNEAGILQRYLFSGQHQELEETRASDTTVTVMIYMNAATLESGEEPFAQYDMEQMLAAELSEQVTVLLQTGGTSHWTNPDISTETTQRYRMHDSGLELLEDTGVQQDMTDARTLRDFLIFAQKEAPADRYILILWGHGRGPQIGYGLDEYQDAGKAMSYEDMADAIQAAEEEAGFYLEWIGFDVCLTGTIETVYALRDCCDYLVVSEDYEPAYGWQYTDFLEALSEDPAMEAELLAEAIIDGFMAEAERSGDRGILAVIDTAYAQKLWQAWQQFYEAAAPEMMEALVHSVWTDETLLTPVPASPDGYMTDDDQYSLQDYGLTDLAALCELSELPEAEELLKLIEESIICAKSFHMTRTMCGLAVYTGK